MSLISAGSASRSMTQTHARVSAASGTLGEPRTQCALRIEKQRERSASAPSGLVLPTESAGLHSAALPYFLSVSQPFRTLLVSYSLSKFVREPLTAVRKLEKNTSACDEVIALNRPTRLRLRGTLTGAPLLPVIQSFPSASQGIHQYPRHIYCSLCPPTYAQLYVSIRSPKSVKRNPGN